MSRNKIDPEHDLDITKPDHNIIAIPTRLNKRAVMNGKAKDQKAVAALSLGSVLLIGLLLNQLISKNNSSNIALVHEGRRGLALRFRHAERRQRAFSHRPRFRAARLRRCPR